ncbi:hypothetical protein PGT21_050167 [Puccinia graminis f. sp. tritici]|uniref:Uncharacterized protein n=2 Tax=Puccinia graminis f. sp. tritici TaxID=56615 RepID=E3JQM5_PUCGT|nr:uncharacterized protein PGTG_00453 [Puccinia graminis f. sp. tritici CRL 75-36-700-3]EFP74497.1 hypothetical protein PGTG_00453 [Puccinia graminis f. sp. tritici CRL 75-36-700-3]KAA1115077.1 hypothetical protein PGT21_050167 [Puccinia graminis f. sp. tritici]
MAPSNSDSQTVKEEENAADEAQDSISLSIRRIEAIRELSGDITPLRPDGSNLQAWVNEIDEVLADVIDREKYLQSAPPVPFSKVQDKVARSLIYRTIPRELRYSLRDASSAHTAYESIARQFLRNTRTGHMSALVDLFNFRMEVTEAGQISLLYDQIYKGFHELVASGFTITEDAILGALFQIALGRSNLELYTAVSQYFDAKMSRGNTSVTSQEVAAVARMQLEHTPSITSASDEAGLFVPSGMTTPQGFEDANEEPREQPTARPNLATPAQHAAESNGNVNAPANFQHSVTPQQQQVQTNHSHPVTHPCMTQQPTGHLANDSSSAHVHQAAPLDPQFSNLGQPVDPNLNGNVYHNVWANQSGPQVPVHQQQANQPYSQQVPHPGAAECQANEAAQQLPPEPTATPAPAANQAIEHPDNTLHKSTPVNSSSHPLASSASGSGDRSTPHDPNLSKSSQPSHAASASSLKKHPIYGPNMELQSGKSANDTKKKSHHSKDRH